MVGFLLLLPLLVAATGGNEVIFQQSSNTGLQSFGRGSTYITSFTQGYVPSQSQYLCSAGVVLTRIGTPSAVQMDVYDTTGTASPLVPGGTVIASTTVAAATVPTSAAEVSFALSNCVALTAAHQYLLVWSASGDNSNYYFAATGADDGLSRVYVPVNGTWTDPAYSFTSTWYGVVQGADWGLPTSTLPTSPHILGTVAPFVYLYQLQDAVNEMAATSSAPLSMTFAFPIAGTTTVTLSTSTISELTGWTTFSLLYQAITIAEWAGFLILVWVQGKALFKKQ